MKTKTLTIELPLPPKPLSGNYRGHTRQQAKWVAAYRQACGILYTQAKIGRLPHPIILHLDFYCAPFLTAKGQRLNDNLYRPKDDDDAQRSFKPGRDALVDAGIVPNDTYKFVRGGTIQIFHKKADHKGERKILLTIEFPHET